MLAEERHYRFLQALQLLVLCFTAAGVWQSLQTTQRTEARVAYIADKVDEHTLQIASMANSVREFKLEQDSSNAQLWRVRMTLQRMGYIASVHNNQSAEGVVAVRADIRELHDDLRRIKPQQLLKPSTGARALPETYYTDSN